MMSAIIIKTNQIVTWAKKGALSPMGVIYPIHITLERWSSWKIIFEKVWHFKLKVKHIQNNLLLANGHVVHFFQLFCNSILSVEELHRLTPGQTLLMRLFRGHVRHCGSGGKKKMPPFPSIWDGMHSYGWHKHQG